METERAVRAVLHARCAVLARRKKAATTYSRDNLRRRQLSVGQKAMIGGKLRTCQSLERQ